MIFCSSSSRPITFEGLSKDTCDELLNILINQIFSNFRACASPEQFLIRAAPAPEKKYELKQWKKWWCSLERATLRGIMLLTSANQISLQLIWRYPAG
jgi:hypothetical protein